MEFVWARSGGVVGVGTCGGFGEERSFAVLPDPSEASIIALVGTLGGFLGATLALLRYRGQEDRRERTKDAAFDGAYVGAAVGLLLYALANPDGPTIGAMDRAVWIPAVTALVLVLLVFAVGAAQQWSPGVLGALGVLAAMVAVVLRVELADYGAPRRPPDAPPR